MIKIFLFACTGGLRNQQTENGEEWRVQSWPTSWGSRCDENRVTQCRLVSMFTHSCNSIMVTLSNHGRGDRRLSWTLIRMISDGSCMNQHQHLSELYSIKTVFHFLLLLQIMILHSTINLWNFSLCYKNSEPGNRCITANLFHIRLHILLIVIDVWRLVK